MSLIPRVLGQSYGNVREGRTYARAIAGATGGAGAPVHVTLKYGEVFIPKTVGSTFPPFYIRGRDTTVRPPITPENYYIYPTRQTEKDIIYAGLPENSEMNIIIKKPWDRYFIYAHLQLQDCVNKRIENGVTLFTPTVGMLVDNHGQAYKFGIKSMYGPYNDRGDIPITADPLLPPLTNPQIDYIKKQAEALGYAFSGVNATEMRTLFGDETARADHARCMEEAARIREQLAQRDEELRIARAEHDTLQARINIASRSFANYQTRRAAEREVPGGVTYNRANGNANVGNPTVIVTPPNPNANNPQGGGARKTHRHRTRRAKTIKRKTT